MLRHPGIAATLSGMLDKIQSLDAAWQSVDNGLGGPRIYPWGGGGGTEDAGSRTRSDKNPHLTGINMRVWGLLAKPKLSRSNFPCSERSSSNSSRRELSQVPKGTAEGNPPINKHPHSTCRMWTLMANRHFTVNHMDISATTSKEKIVSRSSLQEQIDNIARTEQ